MEFSGFLSKLESVLRLLRVMVFLPGISAYLTRQLQADFDFSF